MKIAVVTPWFGRELIGGAEQHAWQIASRLAMRGHEIDVLTTCCRSHQDDWSTNHLSAAAVREPEGFTIRRFPVEARDRESFDRVCRVLLELSPDVLKPGVSPLSREESAVFADELIKSTQLLHFLEAHKADYDWFLFLPYLYGPSLRGIPIVGDRACLQPCLHNEAYAYLPEVAEAFFRAGKLFFNSDGEEELAFRLFGPGIWSKSVVTGEGVEVDGSPARNGKMAESNKFLLYLGRKDRGKNVHLLLRAFARFRAVRPNCQLRLVLAGNGSIDLNGFDFATDAGLVSNERKNELLQNCVALLQPSQSESFSRVMMEAWLNRKPVAAHARCLATAIAVERSGGGWLADSEEQWAGLLSSINRTSEAELAELGEKGRNYALDVADWDRVMHRYESIGFSTPPALRVPRFPAQAAERREIHQVLPNLEYGDAISNHALFIREFLRRQGFVSRVYVHHIDPRVAHECERFAPAKIDASAAIIYHHSVGSEITPHVAAHPGPKCLIYHNITPFEFFEPYRPDFAEVLKRGRQDLLKLARYFPVSAGVSAYNAKELADCGFEDPQIVPICVDPAKWSLGADSVLMNVLQDGRTNILFVGRIAPNKMQHELVRAFSAYRQFDPTGRLVLVGPFRDDDPYVTHVRTMIEGFGLSDDVVLSGSITDKELAAYYRTAHLFWSRSEHEGFGVPFVEAMWFDIPVLAFKSSAVPETLGDAAMTYSDGEALAEIAALAHLLVTDEKLRRRILHQQRKRRGQFLPAQAASAILNLLDQLHVPA